MKIHVLSSVLLFFEYGYRSGATAEPFQFPDDFLLGTGTSAFQVEGAWNVSDKSESIWDHFTHKPHSTADGRNADIAADFYHKYKEDVQLMKSINANTFRFSLAWTRILPYGNLRQISDDGVAFYNNLIDELLANNLTPMVTLYHWDLPQILEDVGGWTNPMIVQWMTDYAEVAFRSFGDRVKLWITINEPSIVCEGYGGTIFAPAVNQSGIADYLCGHNAILAHTAVYHLYNNKFREQQNGKVGITLIAEWNEPADPASILDKEASDRATEFRFDCFAHPLFSDKGDYPATMKHRIAKKSQKQGFTDSRLPVFDEKQIQDAKGAADFLGLNYYIIQSIKHYDSQAVEYEADIGGMRITRINESPILNEPRGLRAVFNYCVSRYNIPEFYITENGHNDHNIVTDTSRMEYLHDHLQEVLEMIDDGFNIKGYMLWSMLDSFEWDNGYKIRFGIFGVDYNSTELTRTRRLSTNFIADVYKNKQIPEISKYISSGQTNHSLLDHTIMLILVVTFLA